MPLEIVRNDITKMKVDAIVNAANTSLQKGGGVCGAIFRAAGASELQEECDQIGSCKVGEAVITDGFKLEAKYIIHTPGPIWQGGTHQEASLLQESYSSSLELAKNYQCESIAFPLISTGIYGYPKEEALQIAISTISSFLLQHDMFVYLVVFDKSSFGISKKLFQSIDEYIDENYVDEASITFNRNRQDPYVLEELFEDVPLQHEIFKEAEYSLVNMLDQLEESFSERLLRFIDEKGMTDVETYKRANMDRKLFSKIRTGVDYTPKKKTAVALAIALGLCFEETLELLSAAGFTLSRSSKFDVIIEYFIQQANYNIHEINEALFAFDQPLLGA
ncbi:O-acetyl-ADP-ribose deacetylase (regulator of RNase III) [Bacillus sp. SLBN-46]|uniref:macro domain-containing protein n=1 Tax=Bacillus sp. SLBN-46 TaxID=3042283 RepID=UPI002860E285|nr:macro domain-containing protein [Bacillus sp. SLBN-46]MDR6123457.1 O-acetyl-ADP-ribose deacetylase (regulator of RNase III) [Bacillus sp. SLBN-46]